MTPEELLDRLAATLRTEVGPAVGADYERTQAFMGAVVIERIARQLRLAGAHAVADEREAAALFAELDAVLDRADVPASLRDALASARDDGAAGLCRTVEALYGACAGLDEEAFGRALGAVRRLLRAQIDRRVEVAR